MTVVKCIMWSLLLFCRVKIGAIMTKVSNNKIHGQYAKAKEAEGSYLEAAKAYETAEDYENCIR